MKAGKLIAEHINGLDDLIIRSAKSIEDMDDEDRRNANDWMATVTLARSVSMVALALTEQPRQVRRVRRF